MTPDTPAMDEKGLADQIEATAHRWAIAAYNKALGRDFEDIDAIKTELRALAATALDGKASQEAEVVKLEWKDLRGHSFPDMWCAVTPCGVYDIEERNASDSATYVALGPNYSFIADKDSLEDAKAAAQADFEARIRSCLATPQPSPDAEGAR